jgi:hypothetical protein
LGSGAFRQKKPFSPWGIPFLIERADCVIGAMTPWLFEQAITILGLGAWRVPESVQKWVRLCYRSRGDGEL